VIEPLAQGWYRDPYAVHQDRYFSAGTATKLVRDGGHEAYDPPPDRPLPGGDLVPAEQVGEETGHGSDLRRADGTSSEPYDPAKARRAALDVFDRSATW
jgi:hypothetical protein